MTTLYLAGQDIRSGNWFPLGRLTRNEADPAEYEFRYLEGVRQVESLAPLWHVPGFPNIDQTYRSSEMFPAFRSRVMDARRPDRPEYLTYLGIDVDVWDELTELSLSGGRRGYSDRFDMFPEIEPDRNGQFSYRFVLHGLRHTNPDSVRRSESLEEGESLAIQFELNSPVDTHALSLNTRDHYTLGWLPRHLVTWLNQDNSWKVTEIEATVARVNRAAPLSHRLLVDFSGRLPHDFKQMGDLPEFQPIELGGAITAAASITMPTLSVGQPKN
jgi:hypothetical protein